jgi:hypothetical protein
MCRRRLSKSKDISLEATESIMADRGAAVPLGPMQNSTERDASRFVFWKAVERRRYAGERL